MGESNIRRATCTSKQVDARGTVRKYTVEFDDGNVLELNNKQVRDLIKSGNVLFINLKIGKNNKIVDCEDGDGNYIIMSEKFFNENKPNILSTFPDDKFDIDEVDTGSAKILTFRGTKAIEVNDNIYVRVIKLRVDNEKKGVTVRLESCDPYIHVGSYNKIENPEVATSLEIAQVLNRFNDRVENEKFYLDADSNIENPTLEQCEELVKHNLAEYAKSFGFTVRKSHKEDERCTQYVRVYESKDSPVRIKVDKYRIRITLEYVDANRPRGKVKLNLISPYSHIEYNIIVEDIHNDGIHKAFDTFFRNTGEIM